MQDVFSGIFCALENRYIRPPVPPAANSNAIALPQKDPRVQLSARAKPKARKTKTLTHGIIAGAVCPFYGSNLASPANPTARGYCWPDIARVTTASASGSQLGPNV